MKIYHLFDDGENYASIGAYQDSYETLQQAQGAYGVCGKYDTPVIFKTQSDGSLAIVSVYFNATWTFFNQISEKDKQRIGLDCYPSSLDE